MNKHLTQGDPAPDDLTPYWEQATRHSVIYPFGMEVIWVRSLIRHIMARGYSKHLFPYPSIGGLLISIPKDGMINYERTLKISFDPLRQHVVLRCQRPAIWEIACPASEVIDTLEHFLNEHPDWSREVRHN